MWDDRGIELWVKRDDLAHPVVSGNKIRKLAYLIPKLREASCAGVLSFGGPHSNHVHALAWLCHEFHVPLTVFIRSYEPDWTLFDSPTLEDARHWGAELRTLSPEEYRKKDQADRIRRWEREFPEYMIVPEGGSHWDAVHGVAEMMAEITAVLPGPDVWMCPVGTGATVAGIIRYKQPDQWVIGVSALKSSVLDSEINSRWQLEQYSKWVIAQQWHFGGYGKTPEALISFLHDFHSKHSIRLDPLYNGKTMYAFVQYVKFGLIPAGSQVVFVHTGGLQGWRGIER